MINSLYIKLVLVLFFLFTLIGGGTSEILRVNIAKGLGS